MLAELLAKKNAEEADVRSGARVLRIIPGGGTQNVWADALAEAADAARRDELVDYALVYVRRDAPTQYAIRHGSLVPTTSILAGANVLNQYLVSRLQLA